MTFLTFIHFSPHENENKTINDFSMMKVQKEQQAVADE
jgi:hypothetical protein